MFVSQYLYLVSPLPNVLPRMNEDLAEPCAMVEPYKQNDMPLLKLEPTPQVD